MTVNRCPIAAAAALIVVASGCSAIRRAHDNRLTAWERSGITVEQAREILGTSPYAVPDLEIVTIHLDAPSQVVMVYQRVKPGVLVSLSQHRGQHVGPSSRAFWARERVNVERVSYAAGPPVPSRYYIPVASGAAASAEAQLVQRRLTRVVDNVTLRIWGDASTEQDLIRLLGAARPLDATQSTPPPR
jgi:hypothetical protein